jgi:AcrR family transcriptional regulator
VNSQTQSKPYHHGDLAASLREAARAILEEEGLAALSLRSVARRSGVSHAAPYRHFPSREALLADVALQGLAELQAEIALAGAKPGDKGERMVHIGSAYLRYATRHAGLIRLMFGSELPHRAEATAAIGEEIGRALRDPAAGLTIWATIHGLTIMVLDDVIDLGQRQAGLQAIPTRAEILLRSLTESLKE